MTTTKLMTNEEIVADYRYDLNQGNPYGSDDIMRILQAKDIEREAAVSMTYDNAQLVLKDEVKKARNEALEEAAAVADQEAKIRDEFGDIHNAHQIAIDIRNLKKCS